MFSKKSALILMALTWLLCACTPRVGEQPPEPKSLELSATKCLNQSADDLKKFFDASVDDAHLSAAWTCVENAFLQFEKYVVGKDQGRYTSQEIVKFLEDNFFENVEKNKITPEMQIELMKLKQIFLGGDTHYVTRDELRKSQAFIQQINRMTVKLNPHMKIIVMKWKPQLDTIKSKDLEAFEVANASLQEFAVELAGLIAKNVSLYRIDDIVVLFREFERFFDADWAWVGDIENLVPGFKKLKLALAGGNENTVDQNEWRPVLTLGARGYFQFLRYQYFIKTAHETGGAIHLVYVARTLEDVFSIFQDLVSQKPTGAVTSHEIYEILHGFEQFWTDLKVSEKLVGEFMKVKQVLIGGNTEAWTAADFEQARLKVPELRRIIENFMPYFVIYASEWDPSMEEPAEARETFEQAKMTLSVVAQDFGRFLSGSYSYDDFIELVNEINELYPTASSHGLFKKKESSGPGSTEISTSTSMEGASSDRNLSQQIAQYRGVFLDAKKMLYNEPDTIIQKHQWAEVLPLVARIFSLYQYYDYFLVDQNLKHTQAILDLNALVDSSMDFARSLLQVCKKGYFTHDELVSLTLKVSGTDLFSLKLMPDTSNSIWTALLQNFLFSPERRLKGEKNDRLTTEQLEILSREFSIWAKTQVVLNDMFNNNSELPLTSDQIMKRLKDSVLQNQRDPELRTGLEGVYSFLQAPITFTLDSEDQLQISNRVTWEYRMNALFQANLTRGLTRLLLRSFSTEETLNRVNQCETQGAFDLLAGVFRDLRIFDPQQDFINSRFLEANIFMSRSNGDKFIDFNELGELINVIFSGLRVNSKLESSLRNVCTVYKTPEGKEFVTFKCMSEHHYIMVRKYMTQLPEFKSYVDKLASTDKGESQVAKDLAALEAGADGGMTPPSSQEASGPQDEETIDQPVDDDAPPPDDEQSEPRKGPRPGFNTWNIVFKQTLKATGWIPNKGYGEVKEESVLLGDALYYPFIAHYIELLYSRFDYTKNAHLQSFEAKKAFPTFKTILKDLAEEQIRKGLIKESDLLSVFTFILRYKEEPSLGTLFKWLAWRNNESKWEKEVWVGRTEIAQILGLIADRTRESAGDTAPVCQ